MTDPRITNILTPRTAENTQPLTRGETALKIISTTNELQNVRQPVRLEGKVSAVSKDGTSATIQTAKGDVTVQLRNNTPLQEGQAIEIDLPAGHPPRQAIVRQSPEATQNPQPQTQTTAQPTQNQTQRPAPVNTQTPAQTQTQNPAQPQQTVPPQAETLQRLPPISGQPALPPDIRAALDQSAPAPAQVTPTTPSPLPNGAIVRLVPLPALPPQFSPEQLLTLPSNTITILNQPASLSANNIVADQIKAILNPLTNPATGPTTNPAEKNVTSPLPNTLLAAPLPAAKALTNNIPGSFDVRLVAVTDTAEPVAIPNAKISPLPEGVPVAPGIIGTEAIETESPVAGKAFPAVAAGFLKADIIATTKEQFPILALLLPGLKAARPYLLQFPATNLPVGTQIEIVPQTLPTAIPGTQTSQSGTPTSPQHLLTGWTWPVFDDAIETLGHMMPQAHMAQSMAAMIPNPATPTTIHPTIAFFIAAIQSGDLASWFGSKAISALRRDAARGGDVLSRLTQDMDGLSRTMDTPVTQDWRGLALPLLWQNDIHKIHLFYRHQEEDKNEESENGNNATRFLFDLNLSKMGDVQIDGLMKARRLDIILRTNTQLSSGMRETLRKKYQNILEAGDLTGDIGFQNRLDQWVKINVEARPTGWKTSA